jgi:hypothetical protein
MEQSSVIHRLITRRQRKISGLPSPLTAASTVDPRVMPKMFPDYRQSDGETGQVLHSHLRWQGDFCGKRTTLWF